MEGAHEINPPAVHPAPDAFMTSGVFFILSLVIAGLSLLTVIKSPRWSRWQLAVLAGEYGHALVGLPLMLGLLTWFQRTDQPWLWSANLALNVLAVGLLLKPAVQAWWIGRTLPERLEREFGPVSIPRAPFSLAGLVAPRARAVRVETLTCGEGLSFDFYPSSTEARAACIVMIHGGGWDSGNKRQMRHVNDWLVSRGYAVAAISYRLAPQFTWPAQREDLLSALTFLRKQAGPLGIDASRIVLMGRSAGGHLAEVVGYAWRDAALRGVVALYAPADLDFAWHSPRNHDPLDSPRLMRQFLGGTPETHPAAFQDASSIHLVNTSTPPTLLLHGRLDTLVWCRQSERLAARFAAARVPHVFVELPWATHAFEFNLRGPGGQLTTYALEWFLTAMTKRPE